MHHPRITLSAGGGGGGKRVDDDHSSENGVKKNRVKRKCKTRNSVFFKKYILDLFK